MGPRTAPGFGVAPPEPIRPPGLPRTPDHPIPGSLAHGARWRPSRGMSVESEFAYSSHTWLHVLSRSTGRETILEMPDKWEDKMPDTLQSVLPHLDSSKIAAIVGNLDGNNIDRHAKILGSNASDDERLKAISAILKEADRHGLIDFVARNAQVFRAFKLRRSRIRQSGIGYRC